LISDFKEVLESIVKLAKIDQLTESLSILLDEVAEIEVIMP